MTESTVPKRKIFVSYSHQPVENAEFVRSLVQRLKAVEHNGIGFDVWLDEERIAVAEDVQDTLRHAILWCDAALFVVNSRWSERERSWIRMEVSLLGSREKARLVVLLRETIETGLLDHTFSTLKHLLWFPDDRAPDARFWEIFCGLTGEMPGPRSDWERKAREISGQLPPPPPGESPPQEPLKLSLAGRPVSAFSADDWTYILTDREEWAAVSLRGQKHALLHAPCNCSAAIVSGGNELLLAAYDGTIARYTGRTWKTFNQPAPVLCFVSSPQGELAGTSSGHVMLLGVDSVTPLFRMRDPVVAMTTYDGGAVAIGARGTLGKISWPAVQGMQLQWLETRKIERPFAFFPTIEPTQIGLIGSDRIGVLTPETGHTALCPRPFEDGIRSIEFLGAQTWPYCLLTDSGALFLLDAGLARTRSVRLPGNAMVKGCTPGGPGGSLIAWAADGRLYRVSPAEGSVEVLADENIVMAFAVPGHPLIYAVRWTPEAGPNVQPVRVD